MKKINIITIILLSISCIACKKIHCPEFPINYFPYYNGQELKFINSKHDIRSFTIANKENSKSETFGQNCKCECYISTSFNTNPNQDSLSIRCEMYISGRGEASDIYLGIGFQNNLDNTYSTKTIDIGKSIPYEKMDKYLENTICIEDENNKIVKKIVIVKDKGLVSYATADGEEWKLVE